MIKPEFAEALLFGCQCFQCCEIHFVFRKCFAELLSFGNKRIGITMHVGDEIHMPFRPLPGIIADNPA